MRTESVNENGDQSTQTMAHAVRACVHFLRVVRYRQTVLIGAVVVCLLLGGLYYSTATRFYQAKASLLVLQTGADVTNTTMTAEGVRQGLMPTYEKLFTSAVVLEGAARHLGPEDRFDFEGVPPENWPGIIRARLSANTVRMTNIIEVSYRSKAPRAAVAVVNAVLQSYLEFMDKTHKGTAGELLTVFRNEKVEIETALVQKEAEVLAARKQFGDLGISDKSSIVHPMVQRVLDINQSLIKAQQSRLETQATLGAIEAAIRNGENLDHHLLALESSIGRELLLAGLGFSERDVALQGELDKQLLEDQTELRGMLEHLGPNHPRIMAINDRIRTTEAYLISYQAKVNQRLAEIRQRQLGPMLLQMVRQRLDECFYHEAVIRANFEQARSEAVALIGERARLDLLDHDLKFLRELRDTLLDKIASVDLRQHHGDIRTAVVSEPTIPKSPVWPKLPLLGLCSLVGGIGVGLALIYILDILDDRFRSPDEMQQQLGSPLLAMVRKMEDLQVLGLEGIQVHVAPDAPASEAFRTLRTSLAFCGQETSRLVVSSPEPGDGKTTVLVNLAVSYCQSGKRTLVIDGDMRRPGLSAMMGLKGQIGLADLLNSSENLDEIAPAHVHLLCPGLDFITAGRRRAAPTELLTTSRMAELLSWAEAHYDQIVIDSPPVLAVNDASIIGRLVDGAVLVVQPAKNRRRLVMRAAEAFTSLGVNLFGVVVNRVGDDKRDTIYSDGTSYGYGYSSEDSPDASEQPAAQGEHPVKPIFERVELLSAAVAANQATIAEEPTPTDRPARPSNVMPRRVA
jgi:polysaccharide biosynthesis transport protein